MGDDKRLILCPPCDLLVTPHVHESTKAHCHKCSCDVWIAPSGIKIVKRTEALITCWRCALVLIKEEPEGAVVLPLTREQIAERIARLQSPN